MPAIFFFFQAEDGIRYLTVTGVQTCALPISPPGESAGPAAEGQAIYARLACVGCHTIQGVSGGVIGPDLTHVGSRRTIAAGLLPNTPENLAAWLRAPERIKPGAKMPNLGLGTADAP